MLINSDVFNNLLIYSIFRVKCGYGTLTLVTIMINFLLSGRVVYNFMLYTMCYF
jgi:hypothetical protein